jgi:hypothetical protein
VVILISLAALGAGKFPWCKSDEGSRVLFGSASSHVLTENYSVIAFRVFALDAIISLYRHVGHLRAWEEATAMIPSQQAPPRPLSLLPNNQVEHRARNCGFARGEHRENTKHCSVAPSPSGHVPAVPLQLIEKVWLSGTFRVSARMLENRIAEHVVLSTHTL